MAGNKKFNLKSEQLFEKIIPADGTRAETPAANPAPPPAPIASAPSPAPAPVSPPPRRLNLPHDTNDRVPLVSSGEIRREFTEDYRQPVNLMYDIVMEHIGDTLHGYGLCQCPRCRMEAASVALNKINSKYVSVFSPAVALKDVYYKKNFAEITSAMLLACAVVKNAPWHRTSVRDQEEIFIENVMERVVATIIKDVAGASPTCQCERCVGDISAFMLNDLPNYYRVGNIKQLIAAWIQAKREFDAMLVPLYEYYAGRVAERPLH
ncbi:MAG: late competence development ComFB family protein [Gracilibacteraceae bacterium]|jgi:hypothetical protein|nr:late competence development ComFB family protein [Gracilibacteraceae bacterium]